jgi:hypothetical protein
MFVHLCLRYEGGADDRNSRDATGKTKHDVHLLALGTFRLIPRDLVFDDLEELNGISATANRGFFFSFLPWLAGLANTCTLSYQEPMRSSCMFLHYTYSLGFQGVLVLLTVSMSSGTFVQPIYKAAATGRRSSLLS